MEPKTIIILSFVALLCVVVLAVLISIILEKLHYICPVTHDIKACDMEELCLLTAEELDKEIRYLKTPGTKCEKHQKKLSNEKLNYCLYLKKRKLYKK